jgi:hypothetical protein
MVSQFYQCLLGSVRHHFQNIRFSGATTEIIRHTKVEFRERKVDHRPRFRSEPLDYLPFQRCAL